MVCGNWKGTIEIPYNISYSYMFLCMGKVFCVEDMLCRISKVPFEIQHNISNPYIKRYDFYTMLKI